MAKSISYGHVHPWSIWFCLCLWSQNLGSCCPDWLGCSSLPSIDVPYPSSKLWHSNIFEHFDRGAHVAFHDEAAYKLLLIKQSRTSDTEDIYGSTWQKVSGLVGYPTPVFSSFCTLFGSCMPLWNQCGIFLHTFCRGMLWFCKYILPFWPCQWIDQSAEVLWALYLF